MSPSPPPTRLRRQLAAELAQLRTLSGLTVRELARRVGLSNHARVSRIQAGALPGRPLVLAWLRETGADEAARERVLALTEAAHAETVRWSDALADDPGRHLQDVAAAREEAATLVCSYQLAFLPGLAQTSDYAGALLPWFRLDQDVAAAVAGRMRRQEILHRPGREFRFVVTPRALAWNPDPAVVSMEGQRFRLAQLDRIGSVSVRVLADDAAPLSALSSFDLYLGGEDPMVAIELDHDEVRLYDPETVALYERRFADLFAAADPIGAS